MSYGYELVRYVFYHAWPRREAVFGTGPKKTVCVVDWWSPNRVRVVPPVPRGPRTACGPLVLVRGRRCTRSAPAGHVWLKPMADDAVPRLTRAKMMSHIHAHSFCACMLQSFVQNCAQTWTAVLSHLELWAQIEWKERHGLDFCGQKTMNSSDPALSP